MKKAGYIVLLAVMLVVSALMIVFYDSLYSGHEAFIFAEVAIFGTLIIFEIKDLKSGKKEKSDCEKCYPCDKQTDATQDKLSDVNNDDNSQTVKKVDEKEGAKDGEGKD